MASRFSCSICLEEFTNPKLIDCHHTFCEKCLADHIKNFSINNRFPCPMCRRDIQVPAKGASGFSSNFYLEDTLKVPNTPSPSLESGQKHSCDVCKTTKGNCASYICKQCQQFMCTDCKTTHDSFSGCFDHVVLSLDEVSLFEDPLSATTKSQEKIFCPKHSKDALEFFCRECWKALCYKCSVTDHSGHKIEEINDEIKAEAVKEVENLKFHMNYTKRNIEEYLNSLAFSVSNQQLSVIAACEQVDKHVATICKEIKDAGEKMKEEIEKTSVEGENTSNKLSKDFNSFRTELESGINNAERILASDSSARIVNILPKLRQQVVESGEIEFIVPERKKVIFREGTIDYKPIFHLLGHLDYKQFSEFQKSFNLNEVETAEWGISSQEFFLKNKVHCSLSVHKKSGYCGATLSLNRQPKSDNAYPHELLPLPKCSFIVELVNADMNKSLMTRLDQAPGTENHMMHFLLWPDVLEWDILIDPNVGFIDENRNVTFRVLSVLKDCDQKE